VAPCVSASATFRTTRNAWKPSIRLAIAFGTSDRRGAHYCYGDTGVAPRSGGRVGADDRVRLEVSTDGTEAWMPVDYAMASYDQGMRDRGSTGPLIGAVMLFCREPDLGPRPVSSEAAAAAARVGQS
jgi:hypothetical protein